MRALKNDSKGVFLKILQALAIVIIIIGIAGVIQIFFHTPDYNLVLITLDTTRLDHLSVYGYKRPTTPNLERLAKQGVVHQNLISSSNWTLPSHATIFTGLFPNEHGAIFHQNGRLSLANVLGRFRQYRTDGLLPGFDTLAAILQEAGYSTAGVGGGPWMHPVFGLNQGFQMYEGEQSDLNGRSGAEITDIALRFLDKASGKFFLFLNYYDPHSPYVEHPEFLHFYRTEEKDLDPVAQMIDRYDGEIAYMDKHVGDFLKHLKARGKEANTLIIVTADHGEHFGEHGGKMGHDTSLYNELIHVPLIIRYPENYKGVRFPADKWHSSAGLFSFALQALGVYREGMERVDLPVSAFLETSPSYPGALMAIYKHPYKLIWNLDGPVELYDIEKDPGETKNLANDRPEAVQELMLLKGLVSSRTRLIQGALPKQQITPKLRRQLQALGYLK